MIHLVEGAKRQKTPNEIALTVLLSILTLIFVIVVAAMAPVASAWARLARSSTSREVLGGPTMLQSWLQIAVTLLIALAISVPVGRYLSRAVTDGKTLFDPVLDPVDHLIYLLIGQEVCRQSMTWTVYTVHMLMTNLVMAVIIYLVLVFQGYLPLNPLVFPGMDPLLAFNKTVSFITNTDWQAYSGETTLSNLSQMAAITFPMFTSAATEFVVAMAFIRAFTVKNGGASIGNFYRDLIRFLGSLHESALSVRHLEH